MSRKCDDDRAPAIRGASNQPTSSQSTGAAKNPRSGRSDSGAANIANGKKTAMASTGASERKHEQDHSESQPYQGHRVRFTLGPPESTEQRNPLKPAGRPLVVTAQQTAFVPLARDAFEFVQHVTTVVKPDGGNHLNRPRETNIRWIERVMVDPLRT